MNGFVAIVRKELTQMMRDRITLIFALAVPVFELILFGTIDMTARDIPTIVLDQSKTQESRQLIQQFAATSLIKVVRYAHSRGELQQAIVAGTAQVAVEVPPDYARNLAANREANVLVLIDGSDSTVATQALGAVNGVALQEEVRNLIATSPNIRRHIDVHPVMTFNPDMRSANLLIPGLIGIILVFSGTILTAFAIVKERERGTLEQLMVTPVSPLAVVVGKLVPYLALAYVTLVIVILLMRYLFGVPFHGSVPLLLVLSSLYLIALLSFGLLISSRANSQVEAMQQAIGVMLPSVLLSGYVFPLSSLPLPLRVVSYLLPATHFIRIARGIIIRGATLADLWQPIAALVAIAVVLMAASTFGFKKRMA